MVPARNRVCLKDRPAQPDRPERKGILAALLNRDCPGVDPDLRSAIDTKVAKARTHVRWSRRASVRRNGHAGWATTCYRTDRRRRRVPGLARQAHVVRDVYCRVRQYTLAQASSEDDASG